MMRHIKEKCFVTLFLRKDYFPIYFESFSLVHAILDVDSEKGIVTVFNPYYNTFKASLAKNKNDLFKRYNEVNRILQHEEIRKNVKFVKIWEGNINEY